MNSETEYKVNPLLDQLCSRFSSEYGAHTVLLYGSYARNQQSPASDVDIAAFADVERPIREAFDSDGVFVDAFIYPETVLDSPCEEHLKLRESKILLDQEGRASGFLQLLSEKNASGPEPLPPDELEARRVWASKMLQRIADGGVEGNYRRTWLLTDMLEDYFHLRGLWYEGPKRSLKWLKECDASVFSAIEEALQPRASIEVIKSAVELIYSSRD